MKKDFRFTLKALDGSNMKDEKGDPATAKNISLNALDALDQQEMALSGEEKVKKYDLMLRINNSDDVDLDENEIVLLKKLIGKFWGPLVVGQMYDFLKI